MKVSRDTWFATARSRYLWGAATVWAAIWLGTAVVLKGSGEFAGMIPILAIGTGWFIAVVPAQLPGSEDAGPGQD
ncbi:hypothetical protein ACT8ZV_16525 [Nocardioides sp. MAHUQ-72]|uniref:hypothetical protein n=1 Tax=unclassified Nocardioides TaxID=2615069 RepID=UPI003613F6F2